MKGVLFGKGWLAVPKKFANGSETKYYFREANENAQFNYFWVGCKTKNDLESSCGIVGFEHLTV